MTIKEKIMNFATSRPKNRKSPLTFRELDKAVCAGGLNVPELHSVRARVSELVSSGQLVRVSPGEYRLPTEEMNGSA